MATFKRQLAIAFGGQGGVFGTADPTIAALSGSIGLNDGIVRGDAASGLIGSGITHSFARRENPGGFVPGSFTRLDGDFLEEEVTLTFAFPLAGTRVPASNPPVASDFSALKGIEALLKSVGLEGAASVSNPDVGFKYAPVDAEPITAKLFDSGFAWVIRDILGDISISMPPGEVAVATCTLSGIIDSGALVAFPTVDFGVQSSVNAPAVVSVAPSWGISDEVRGWTELTIALTNSLEEVPDSAQSTGVATDQTGREITVNMTIRDTDTDVDFTRANLVGTTAPTADLKALVGTPAAAGDPATAYQIEVSNLRVLSNTPAVAGSQAASRVTARATGTVGGSEFFIAFL